MTEVDWETCDDLRVMLEQPSMAITNHRRRLRLFSVACCRQLGRWVADERLWDALAAAERYADGLIKDAGLDRWTGIANRSWFATEAAPRKRDHKARIATHRAIAYTTLADRYAQREVVPLRVLREQSEFGRPFVERMQVLFPHLLRDIFGNPFLPVTFDPRWRSESAVALARTAYDTRDFSILPILADALEEAGCDHPDVLAHCRQPDATHVRGCWVVDGVLGKS